MDFFYFKNEIQTKVDIKRFLMTQDMISFQNSSHQRSSSFRRAHSWFPPVNFDTFSFLCSREIVSYVSSNNCQTPTRWSFHCNWVWCHQEVVAKNICRFLKERTETFQVLHELLVVQIIHKLTQQFWLDVTSWKFYLSEIYRNCFDRKISQKIVACSFHSRRLWVSLRFEFL